MSDVLVVQITHPDQLKRAIPDLTRMFEDFLRRAREPFSVEHQWAALLRALTQEYSLFLVAFGDRMRPVGFAVAQAGFDFFGVGYCNLIQMYAKPGVAGVVEALYQRVEQWAEKRGVQAISLLTLRHGRAFQKLGTRHGFAPYAVLYLKLKESADGQGKESTFAAASS